MKIYTKTGDKGTTSLVGGTRVCKADNRLEAYGTIDELNAHIGLLNSYNIPIADKVFLTDIQHLLFIIGSNLATDTKKTALKTASQLDKTTIETIEKEIDNISEELPKLTNFTIPGGSTKAAQCHICRTIARRAERKIVQIALTEPIDKQIITYINRLSDYFFVLSRKLLKNDNICEITWKKQK